MMEKKNVDIYVDGSCSGNPGPCGIAYVIIDGSKIIQKHSEYVGEGTNNFAELLCVKKFLEKCPKEIASNKLLIYTDSTYVIGVLSKNWVAKANQELIMSIRKLMADYDIGFVKVKAHSDCEYNNMVDSMAQAAVKNRKS